MTLHADTVWEVRTTGAQTNGGGFYNRVPGVSVDYSQQNATQLSLADIATDGAGTGLSSATGGFTAAMQGNIIYLTGGGATAGWYEIVSYINGNNVTIDRSAGLNKVGVTGNVGGAFTMGGSLDNDFFGFTAKVVGNQIWIKSGTYTLGETILPAQGPILVIGYNSTRGDSPIGNSRPSLNCGSSYQITLAVSSCKFNNLIFTGSGSDVLRADGGTQWTFENCKFVNTKETAGGRAFYTYQGYNTFVSCEFSSLNGTAIYTTSSGVFMINCYIHDCDIGIRAGMTRMVNSVVANCATVGISVEALPDNIVFGCIIYNCATGISGTTAPTNRFINNIISGCATGASWTTEQKVNFWDFNCWNNTIDVSNVTKGPNDITADPKLKDPDNGDFTLDEGSPCFDAGIQLGAIVGL